MGRASGRALKARPPGPPKAQSKKPESQGAFFGLKIGRFSTNFWLNLDKIMGHFVTKKFSFVFGHYLTKIGPFSAEFWPSSKFKNFN